MTPKSQTGNGTTAEPEVLHFDPNTVRINPQAMRMLTVATGRTMEQLMQSEEPADKFQAMAFFELRRRHPELGPDALWELAGTVEIELGDTGTVADPLETKSVTAAPAFAHYWRLHPDTIDDLDPDMYAAMVRLMAREAAAIKAANAKAGRR